MQNSELDAISREMMTPEFINRLIDAQDRLQDFHDRKEDYTEAHFAKDLGVPLPVTRILVSFLCALNAEHHMRGFMADAARTKGMIN